MRLLVYYNPNKDIFVTNYKNDRFDEIDLLTYNHYGHLIVQYIYVRDKKIFWNRKTYEKYLKKKNKEPITRNIRFKLGQGLIKLGKFICYGRDEKIRYVYVYKNRYWR